MLSRTYNTLSQDSDKKTLSSTACITQGTRCAKITMLTTGGIVLLLALSGIIFSELAEKNSSHHPKTAERHKDLQEMSYIAFGLALFLLASGLICQTVTYWRTLPKQLKEEENPLSINSTKESRVEQLQIDQSKTNESLMEISITSEPKRDGIGTGAGRFFDKAKKILSTFIRNDEQKPLLDRKY